MLLNAIVIVRNGTKDFFFIVLLYQVEDLSVKSESVWMSEQFLFFLGT